MSDNDSAPHPSGPTADSVVKKGGIAREDADTEDVSRDTYGFSESNPPAATPEERFAEAERVAEAEGIPGIVTPDDLLRSDSGAAESSGRVSTPVNRQEGEDVE